MKAKKLMLLVAFAGFGIYAGGAFAQGNDQTQTTESTPPPTTGDGATTGDNSATTGQETDPYNEKVTIDDSATNSATTSDAGIAAQPEKREKLRVYSGKHDGNNVISDPR